MNERPKNKIVDFIFNNIQIVVLFFLFLVIAGGISFFNMKREGFPSIAVNVVMVSSTLPGASSMQIEDQVLRPLEDAFSSIDEIKEYQTIASSSIGMGVLTIDEKANFDETIREISSEMAKVDLPDDASEINVSEIETGTDDIFLAVTGIDDQWQLYYEAKNVQDDLEMIDGVKYANIINPIVPRISIDFVQDRLKEHGLTRQEVEDVITTSNIDLPVGSFRSENDKLTGLSVSKKLRSASDIRNLEVAEGVRLSQVANVWIDLDNQDQYNRVGYHEDQDIDEDMQVERALMFGIKADADADIIELDARIRAELDDITDDLPDGAEVVTLYSMADFTQGQIDEISSGVFGKFIDSLGPLGVIGYLLGAVSLVLILLLIFINARVAIMAAMSIPLALGATSIFLTLLGISLNTMVLFSMVVVIGLVVDPTIVFLESIQRHLEQGYRGREAAAKTFQTVGAGISLAVITNFLVFVPFGVVSGVFGEIIKYIPLTVIPAVIFSFIIPVLFYLPLGVRTLKAGKPAPNGTNPELVGVWKISKTIGRGVRSLLGPGIGKAALRVAIIVVAAVLPLVISGALFSSGAIKAVQFASSGDSDILIVSATVDENWEFDKAVAKVAVPVQNLLKDQEEIRDFMYFPTGGTMLDSGGGSNSFMMIANLFPSEVRQAEDMRTGIELIDDLNDYLEKIDDAEVEAMLDDAGPPSSSYPIQIQIMGNDLETLEAAADDVVEFLEDEDGVLEATHTLQRDESSQNLSIILDNGNSLNRSPFLAFSVLREKVEEKDLGDMTIDGEVYSIQTRLQPQLASLDDVKETTVIATPVGKITIDDIADDYSTTGSASIQRLDGKRYVEVKASLDEDTNAVDVQLALNEYLDDDKLDELNLGENAIQARGDFESISNSFTDLFIALIIAIFMIYVLLVAFFRSLLTPFAIIFAIPLGFIGVMPTIAMVSGELGFLELLGVVIMAGIVVNVTILLIDFANQLRREGYKIEDAIAVSTAVRLRPIFLTQATAFGSLVPLAIYAPFWSGMASVIVAGIIFSALLSLATTPILYVWFEAVTRFFRNISARFSTN